MVELDLKKMTAPDFTLVGQGASHNRRRSRLFWTVLAADDCAVAHLGLRHSRAFQRFHRVKNLRFKSDGYEKFGSFCQTTLFSCVFSAEIPVIEFFIDYFFIDH
jgi:hypothetical protein